MLLVMMTSVPEHHSIVGIPMQQTSKLTSITISLAADTGCQSMIISLKATHVMGIRRQDFIPVRLTMHGAIRDLSMIVIVTVSVSIRDAAGSTGSTCQLFHVSDKMRKAFLCREVLSALGVIPPDFLTASTTEMSAFIASTENSDFGVCSCPKLSQEPPSLPTTVPEGLSVTDKNVDTSQVVKVHVATAWCGMPTLGFEYDELCLLNAFTVFLG